MDRPTLKALIERTTNDIISRINEVNAYTASDARVYAAVFAGLTHSMYGYIEWLWKQSFAHLADGEYLADHANFWHEEARNLAVSAVGVVSFAGAGVIPKGTIIRNSAGIEYLTDREIIAPNTVTARAKEGGAVSNMIAGSLQLTSPIAGVNSTATTTGFSGGADEESVEDFRARILAKQSARPIYGKAGDYIIWALEVDGITRAWEQKGTTNNVIVYVVSDGSIPITPNPTKLTEVQAYMQVVRPICADVIVLAPTLMPVAFSIALSPNDTATRQAVTNSLNELFKNEASVGGTVLLSHIREAISTAAGENDHNLISPTANQVAGAGELLTVGTITFSTL